LAMEAAQPGALERQEGPIPGWQGELHALSLANVLLHGSGALHGGATCFALFGMPQRPGARQVYFMELLLPHLHLALLRLAAVEPAVASPQSGAGERACSRREMEILCWVREGKSNEEVGQILGISGLTVKNHLQRIYKTLGVSNRTQAVARGIALRLFDGLPAPQARA
jgi:transcriptional regulator EpsA